MKVLVIEDEARVAEALSRGLQADGFSVDTVGDGNEGLWMALSHPYSLVVLDILLPGLNGFRVCTRLRDAGVTTPILMLTAKHGDEDQIEGLEAGADDYLTKPFSYRVLLARIRALLRRASHQPGARTLTIGNLTVDVYARRVLVDGDELVLTPRAMAVLEYLARHDGGVVSKHDILSSVWDSDFEGDPNIVEVYVSRLRHAVEAAGAAVRIDTIRGAGYRLRVADLV